ncbi:MAG TPA: glycosyltransferase [Verrucomicrobiae bacterium]|nr:glycosyltransferase [Verrucomicrobiae bacterium]
MNLSVIICTHNRAAILRQTLETFCQLRIDSGLKWELVLVDNNSSDDTRAVADEFRDRLPVRYVFELKQGLSAARNRGAGEAGGEILLFTDDDVDVDPLWLTQFWKAARKNPEAVFWGGKILPRWEKPPPRWLAENSAQLLGGAMGHLDLGDEPRWLQVGGPETFFGGNMAFRRELLVDGRSFDMDLGRNGAQLVHGEETALIKRLVREGYKGLYVPGAIVYHRTPATNMTELYVRRWFRGYGVTKVRNGEAQPDLIFCGWPLKSVRKSVVNAVKYVFARRTRPARVWLKAETKMAMAWGIAVETHRRSRS